MLQMYGIKNCDTVKKARKFLDDNSVAYEFHDFKKEAPTKKQIETWLKSIDWKILLNMRGMTWRKLQESERESINKTNAIKLMLDNASIIKRPIIEQGNHVFVGFDIDTYTTLK
jgi:arsenate reductase